MTMNSLLTILPSPINPRDAGTREDWPRIEQAIGIGLPSDYKEYVNSFGTGRIASLLLPFNPFSKNMHLNLIEQKDEILGGLRYDDLLPYPLYPEPKGVLPWGTTDNGQVLSWLTDGVPDKWPVAILAVRNAMYERYDEDMTSFIARLLSREIVSTILPDTFPGDNASLFERLK